MKRVDMIVKAPFFYTMEGEGLGYKEGVAMVVDGSKIVEFVPADEVELAISVLKDNDIDAYVIGEIIEGEDKIILE